MKVGDLVLAAGSPFGLTGSVTMGIVSALGRGGMGIVDYENFIQTDASINPGNSGGALVDIQGRLIGINTAIYSRSGGNQGIGFAVPSNLARNVMDSLLKYGNVARGFLGTVRAAAHAGTGGGLQGAGGPGWRAHRPKSSPAAPRTRPGSRMATSLPR